MKTTMLNKPPAISNDQHTRTIKKIPFIISIWLIIMLLAGIGTTAISDSEPMESTEPTFLTTDLPQTRATNPPDVLVTINPKEPVHLNPVNITIESKYGQEITWAYISITFIKSGLTRKGNYPFVRFNETIWSVIVPGDQNQGDTDAVFYVNAWFDDEEVKTKDFEYRTTYLGTWQYPEFKDNINLKYSPTSPIAGQVVNVSIDSKYRNVPIKLAILRVKVNFPGGYEDQEGGKNFTRINSTSLYATIPGYGGSTNVSFWVDAYDDAMTKITSKKYNYVVGNPPSAGKPQTLYIYLYDQASGDLVRNANITISNKTWSYSTENNEGIVWSPYALNQGEYTIVAIYEDEKITKKVSLPQEDDDYSEVQIVFNTAKAIGLIEKYEDFPQWFVYVAFITMICVGPLFYFFYTELQRKAKEEEAKIQKQMRTERRTGRQTRTDFMAGARDRASKPGGPGAGSGTSNIFTMASLKAFWEPGSVIRKILGSDHYKAITVRVLGFFILGVFAGTWAPFYPWWMVLVISIIVAAIAYRFTYLSLLVLIFFIIGSTAYQNPAFGWIFMVFALVISVISLFDWRFGYLVFLTLFMSRLGIAFFVPVASGLLLSLFMGLAVAVASGIFLTFMVTSADFTILSFFVGPSHEYGYITFSKPVISNFMPTHYVDALSSIYNDVNLNSLATIMHSNYTSMVPFIQIILWTLMVFVFVYLFQRYGKESLKNSLLLSLVPSAILIVSGLGSILGLKHSLNIGTALVLVGIIGVMLTVITFTFMNMELFKEFYLGKTREMPIGTRIGEMLTLRKTGFTEIGGLKEIKRELKDNMIGPLLRPEKAREYGVEPPRGIMLFGPPGCGKTLLMRALATELKVEMVGVRCSDVMSKWYGESEGMIEKLFQEVKARRPCILFLDEIDAIAKRRDFYSADDVTPRLLSIMLSELDGMDEAAGVIVVGATNKPELVDPALMRPGRFDKIIFIPAPNYNSRKEIFNIHLKGKPYSPNINLDNLARGTEGYSGADIENLVKEAATLAMKRSIRTRRRTVISNDDFLKILPRIKPSLTHEMKKEYDQLQADFERKKYGREIKLPPTEEEQAGAKPKRRARGAPRPMRAAPERLKAVPEHGIGRRKAGRRGLKKRPAKWRNVVGLSSSKRFFKNTIENNLTGGK